MKQVSNIFKNKVKSFGRQIDSVITYNNGIEDIELKKPRLNGVEFSYEGSILKSVMKQLVFDVNEDIPKNTIVNYKFGVMINESTEEYEYINFGNFIVSDSEKKEDTNSYKITCYDKMLYSMKDYETFVESYPITIRDYITQLARYINLDFVNKEDTFPNYDKEITKELYLNTNGVSIGYTFRDVLDELAQATASTICINSEDKIELRYIPSAEPIPEVETIDSRSLKDINVNFGEKYGPINAIVLTRAGDSDSIYLQDTQSIAQYGLCELKISENQIMNFNDRDQYLSDILTQLDGLEFYINDYSSTGITYLELCDRYNVEIEDKTYPCIMLNDEIKVSQGLEETIHCEAPKGTITNYSKSDKTDRRINQTYIIADKQQGQIEALTNNITTLTDELGNVYTKDQIEQLLIDSEHGFTNTFSEAGGNNIFRNTGLWFPTDDENNPYEFWTGSVIKTSEEKAANRNALLLKDSTLSQQQSVPNGNYTISFKYKVLNSLANCSVVINDVSYPLTSTTESEFITGQNNIPALEISSQTIKVQFISDIDEACEIYDLMVNAGKVKLAYSQNQNETTTDTVNISKGITITSSDTYTTFKANADGIRTLDNSNNELAKFTDKGMTTKEMVVEGKSEISGLLIQEIGNQTWITKI